MPRHLIGDAHEWINEIPTVPTHSLAKLQPSQRSWDLLVYILYMSQETFFYIFDTFCFTRLFYICTHTHTHTYIQYVYIKIYMLCIRMCVCVCIYISNINI
jgi:hypothetical protein